MSGGVSRNHDDMAVDVRTGTEIPRKSVRCESCRDQTCFVVGDLSPEETRRDDCFLRPGSERPWWRISCETIVYRQVVYFQNRV